jgi:hypothetical protein
MAVMPAMERLSDIHAKRTSMAAYTATPPVRGFQSFLKESMGKNSDQWADTIIDYVQSQKIPQVLLIANWLWYYNHPQDVLNQEESLKKFEEDFAHTIRKLNQVGAKVWVFQRVPLHTPNYHIMLAKQALDNSPLEGGMEFSAALEDKKKQNQMLSRCEGLDFEIIDPVDEFYHGSSECRLVDDDGYLLYIDNNHLSSKGAIYLEELFEPIFTRK